MTGNRSPSSDWAAWRGSEKTKKSWVTAKSGKFSIWLQPRSGAQTAGQSPCKSFLRGLFGVLLGYFKTKRSLNPSRSWSMLKKVTSLAFSNASPLHKNQSKGKQGLRKLMRASIMVWTTGRKNLSYLCIQIHSVRSRRAWSGEAASLAAVQLSGAFVCHGNTWRYR